MARIAFANNGAKTSIMLGEADLMQDTYGVIPDRSIDLYYTDPPWNDGNVKMFYTYLKKATGRQPSPPKVSELIDQVLRVAELKLSANGVLVLETTVHEKNAIFTAIANHSGLRDLGGYQNIYTMGGHSRPYECRVIVRRSNNTAYSFQGGKSGFDFLRTTIDTLKPNSFLDTSAGFGLIVGEAIKKSIPKIYGFELNPVRLNRAIEKAKKLQGKHG